MYGNCKGNVMPDCKGNGIPRGTEEVYGGDYERKAHIINKLEAVVHKHGFDPLDTPVLEYANRFNGHKNNVEWLPFKLHDKEDNNLQLRSDLTVALANYLGRHREEIHGLFKRFQIGTLFRDYPSGLREIMRCDADIVGSDNLANDAEIITLAYAGLAKLGFSDFVISVNHCHIANAIFEKVNACNCGCGHNVDSQKAFEEISKLKDKWEHYNGPEYQHVYLEKADAIMAKYEFSGIAKKIVHALISITGSFDEKLTFLREYLGNSPEAYQGIEIIRDIMSYLDPEVKAKVTFDPIFVREFDYYTGLMLEGNIPNIPGGEVLGGGRFDNLIREHGGPDMPAVGVSFFIESIASLRANKRRRA